MADWRSYHACVLSIKWLFRGVEARELWDAPSPEAAYLWTFTFPDEETRRHPKLAMRRWRSFTTWFHKTKKQCVRTLEVGEKGAWHFHAVTPQRWDAQEMWAVASGYGIGRIDARARPLSAAFYVAKYAGKRAGKGSLPRGMRQWGCIGFEGVAKNRLKRTEKTRDVVRVEARKKLFDVLQWWTEDTCAFTHRYRPPHDGPDEINRMELKPAQIKEVVSKLVGGVVCAVGEFRGVAVKSISYEDRTKPGTKIERVIVEYSVELGGAAAAVQDWQKPGVKEADVKPSQITRGEPCLCLLESVAWVKGAKKYSGVVRSLPSLV